MLFGNTPCRNERTDQPDYRGANHRSHQIDGPQLQQIGIASACLDLRPEFGEALSPPDAQPRQSIPDHEPQQNDQRGLQQTLPHQTRARRTERIAQGQFAAALQQPGEKHHTDVHAADQQHRCGDEAQHRHDRREGMGVHLMRRNQRQVPPGVEQVRIVVIDAVSGRIHLVQNRSEVLLAVHDNERE